MNWVIAAYLGTALLALLASLLSFRRRKVPGMLWLAWMLLGAAEWSFGNALELSPGILAAYMPPMAEKLLWAKLQYIGILCAPTFMFLFALEYNRLERWLTKRVVLFLILDPIAILLLVWTNDWHHLFWSNISLSTNITGALVYSHGPAFWAGAAFYSFFLIGIASLLLLWRAYQTPTVYRPNAVILFLCSAIPVAANLLYLFNRSPIGGLDPTPIAFGICGSLSAFAVLRWGLFDIVPIARNLLIDATPDGILVLDRQQRIVDVNPAAESLLGWKKEALFGKSCAQVLPGWPEWESKIEKDFIVEFVPERNSALTLELRAFPLRQKSHGSCEYMFVLRDITKNKWDEEELRKANQILRVQLEEIRLLQETLRDQAVRDPLTGLYNRRYLAETLDREMARAQRLREPVSIVIIDLDHFKEINDTHGHRAGDEILRLLSTILHNQTRRGDISCRYGGDEFVVILPGASLHIARERAEEWRAAFATTAYANGKTEVFNTFSAGIAIFPRDGATAEELLTAADKALYSAKSSGRNRIVTI